MKTYRSHCFALVFVPQRCIRCFPFRACVCIYVLALNPLVVASAVVALHESWSIIVSIGPIVAFIHYTVIYSFPFLLPIPLICGLHLLRWLLTLLVESTLHNRKNFVLPVASPHQSLSFNTYVIMATYYPSVVRGPYGYPGMSSWGACMYVRACVILVPMFL